MKNEVLLPERVREYLKEHHIQGVITSALNKLLTKLPEDPFSSLAEDLAEHCVSAPELVALRRDREIPRGEIRFDVVVSVRGVRARVHSFVLQKELVPALCKDISTGDAAHDLAENVAREEKLVAFLEEWFRESLGGTSVDCFLSFYDTVSEGLALADLGEAKEEGEEEESKVFDVPRTSSLLVDELLVAASNATDTTSLGFLQQLLSRFGPDYASPPLRCTADVAAWHSRWPRLAFPTINAGPPSSLKPASMRFCAALTPFAAGAPEADPGLPEDFLASGAPNIGFVGAVSELGRAVQAEVAKLMQADKALAPLVVNGVPHAQGFADSLQLLQKAGEAVVGEGNNTLSCVLLAAATEAWIDDEGVYEIEAGKKLTLEQLVELYAEVCEDGFVKTIVQPFRLEDVSTGCELLASRRPEVRLVMDYGEATPPLPGKGSHHSFVAHVPPRFPARVLREVGEATKAWREAGGCARVVSIDAEAASTSASPLDVALAVEGAEVVLFSSEVAPEDLVSMSDRMDEVLYRAAYGDDA